MKSLLHRASAAWQLLVRGSIAPFDKIPLMDGSGGSGGEPLKKPFAESIWVHAAIRHIARPVAAVPLVLSATPRQQGMASASLADPRLENFWTRPAKGLTSRAELLLASIGWRKLAGECFWILGDDALIPFPEARERFSPILVATPDRMRHVVADGELTGWEYTDAMGRRHHLLPAQVIHLRQWNPYDEHRGLGSYEAARIAAAGDVDASRFARNLAASNGDQGVYVVAKGPVEDAQRKQIVAALRDKADLQKRGVFRPVFLTHDITVQDPKVRSVDAAYLEGRRMSAAEIYVAFGVPPSMSAESASYSIGGASDYYRLILDTCMPEAEEIAAGIATVSGLLTGRALHAWFDWANHPVLQEVRKERTEAAARLWGMGVPVRVVSQHLDLGLPKFEGDDIPWIPVGVMPADQAALPIDPSAANEPGTAPAPVDGTSGTDPVADPVRSIREALAARRQTRGQSRAEARLWAWHMRLRAPAVAAFRSAFTRTLFRHRAEALRRLESLTPAKAAQEPAGAAGGVQTPESGDPPRSGRAVACREHIYRASSGEIVTRAGVIDFILGIGQGLTQFARDLIGAFRGIHAKVEETAVTQLAAELGRDPEDPLTVPPPAAQAFLAARENRIADAAQSTFDAIRAELQAGIDAGDTTAQLADRVRSAFNGISKERATRIAMTETAAAYGHARQEGMKAAGVQYKQWLTSGADNVRPAHAEANRQIARVEDAFDVGGELLMHPGDPSGSAGNVINCHCVSVAVPPEDLPDLQSPA